MTKWVRTVEQRTQLGKPADPIVGAVSLRYDEFASKDVTTRTATVKATLVHLGALASNATDAALAPALEVFGTHSQAGTAQAGPKTKIVQPRDVPLIHKAVDVGLAPLASLGVVVQGGGANVALPRSLGLSV